MLQFNRARSSGRAAHAPAGVATMPSGLIGYWNTDTYNSTAKSITNEVDGTSPIQNLLRLPRRMFGSGVIWGGNAVTFTDDFAVGPDGLTQATRVVGTGATWNVSTAITTAAGTYTLGVWVKSNTGSSQNIRMWLGSFGLVSKTVTTSWTRITVTGALTAAGQTIYPVFSDGTNNGDILICDAQLFAGSSDLGASVDQPRGHLYLGITATSAPAVSGGLITADSKGGIIQFGADQVLSSGFTVFGVASKTTATTTYQAILTKIQSYTAFGAMFEINDVANSNYGGVGFDGTPPGGRVAGLIRNPIGQGLLFFGVRYDGVTADLFINDLRVESKPATIAAQTVRELYFALTNGAFSIDYNVYSIGFANRAWSLSEIRNAIAAQTARALTSGLTLSQMPRSYVAEGDSRSAETYDFCDIYNANASPKIIGTQSAISGSGLADMVARAADTDTLYRSGKTNLLSIMIGVNDLSGYSTGTAGYLADLAAYCDARRTVGWKVIVCTMLPSRARDATYESRRLTCNSTINSSWTGVHCDGVADFAGNATMGPLGVGAGGSGTTPGNTASGATGAYNTDYYPDGLHPNAAGHTILETIFRPVANAL